MKRRCGACGKTFDSPKKLVDHIQNDCNVAGCLKEAVDGLIPFVAERGLIISDEETKKKIKKEGIK